MPTIFISYRRSDSQDVTGRIYDRLVSQYTSRQIFKDVDSIPFGVSFPAHIRQLLHRANIALVVIGPGWLSSLDDDGRRRLDDPNDFVRLEVEAALKAGMPVIPVLVSNARMPSAKELPAPLRGLASRNAVPIRPDPDFNRDMERLFGGLDQLEKLLVAKANRQSAERKPPIRASTPAPPAPAGPASAADAAARPVPEPPSEKTRVDRRIAFGLFGLLAVGCIVAASFCVSSWWRPGLDVASAKKDGVAKNGDGKDPGKNALGVALVPIKPGKFFMGSPLGEAGRLESDFEERHEVEITLPFEIGAYEITRGQFRAFVDETEYLSENEGNDTNWHSPGFPQTDAHPAVFLTWRDAKMFCKWLSAKESKLYTLPTEAEWEYVCRAGTTTAYATGDAPETLRGKANVNLDGEKKLEDETKAAGTMPVGSFKPNAWGAHDMIGNAYEWCEDWFAGDYQHDKPKDPRGPESGERRVARGGAYSTKPAYCRSAKRFAWPPAENKFVAGFRVVRRAQKFDLHGEDADTQYFAAAILAKSNASRAQERFAELAYNGHAGAMVELGKSWLKAGGKGDQEKALDWFRKANAKGDTRGKFFVAYCRRNGYGVAADAGASLEYEDAARSGHAGAQFELARAYQDIGDQPRSLEWYTKSAQREYGPAMNKLGDLHRDGGLGVVVDSKLAFGWYQKAADLGYAEAQYNLGGCYEKNVGLDPGVLQAERMKKACEWYDKAAKNGNAKAKDRLYELGG